MKKFFYYKTSSIIVLSIFSTAGLSLGIIALLYSELPLIFNIIYIFLIIGSIYFSIELYSKKIIINTEGVGYSFIRKKYRIKWEDVRYVEVRLTRGGYRLEALCFSTKWIQNLEIDGRNNSNDFIMMLNIKKSVIKEVRRYWKGEIRGIDNRPK